MSSKIIHRFSIWYNKLENIKQRYLLAVFCLSFLTALWLGIHFIRFNVQVSTAPISTHIGRSSGLRFTDTTQNRK